MLKTGLAHNLGLIVKDYEKIFPPRSRPSVDIVLWGNAPPTPASAWALASDKKKKTTQGWVFCGVRRHAEPLGDDDPPRPMLLGSISMGLGGYLAHLTSKGGHILQLTLSVVRSEILRASSEGAHFKY